ncbi:lysophospholipid acyltransferase family protein [Desulfovibrio sp. OttesenSCG-928-G15]|nr:lysophospholipid acyltransferase family protein [Desulfovibrio sp. OttesenSCG-928-G15]
MKLIPPPWLVGPVTTVLYRIWCSSLRIKETGREPSDALHACGKPLMICLWHDELFALMHVRRQLKIVTVVSRSNDGEYLARLLQALGLVTARGSSSRGGLSALLQASRLMRDKGFNGCITVDGPRGPRHEVKPGAVFLAARTPAHIVPIRLFLHKAKVFNSWDRFQLPLPFSRVDIVWGEPYLPEITSLDEESLRHESQILQERLETLCPPDTAE